MMTIYTHICKIYIYVYFYIYIFLCIFCVFVFISCRSCRKCQFTLLLRPKAITESIFAVTYKRRRDRYFKICQITDFCCLSPARNSIKDVKKLLHTFMLMCVFLYLFIFERLYRNSQWRWSLIERSPWEWATSSWIQVSQTIKKLHFIHKIFYKYTFCYIFVIYKCICMAICMRVYVFIYISLVWTLSSEFYLLN